MSETTPPASPLVVPKVVVSKPAEETEVSPAKPTLASRQRSQTESTPATEHIDTTNESPRKRKKASHRSTSRGSDLSAGGRRSRRHTESGIDRFVPKLARVLETGGGGGGAKTTARPATSGSECRKQPEKGAGRKARRKEEYPVGYRRAVKSRAGGVSRRVEPSFRVNPSLLSVLSSLTRSTERSSSSSATTITQSSYDRRKSGRVRDAGDRQHSETEPEAKRSSSPPCNVFDYMDATTFEHDLDGQSTFSRTSSSSSHYEPSDAGFSEISGTPSSQSTCPSPIGTRKSSVSSTVAELRRKYDSNCVASAVSPVSPRRSSQSPETPARYLKQSAKWRASVEDDDEGNAGTTLHADVRRDERPSPKLRSSRPTQRADDPLRYQEDALRRHLAQVQHGPHYIDPVYGQHRSASTSSHGSNGSARAYAPYMAMQPYQFPAPPGPMAYPPPPQAMNGHIPHPNRPPVPDAPDLSQRTLAGYEQLALELARYESPVKPLYRKFEYLNHRILLHMQDELCEMEEQLRTMDEIIAQMEPLPPDGQPTPASRRGDAFSGTDMHYRRTALLGRIFLKTEQYNRAMSSFATLNKDSQPAEPTEVATYRDWLNKKSPIHELETRFLQREEDLILPGKAKPADMVYRPKTITTSTTTTITAPTSSAARHAALTCLGVALMLPLFLFTIVPNTIGRLAVIALIALGALLVAATTPMRRLLPPNEWAVCGAAYVLLMAAIAGCLPHPAT